MSEDLMLRKEAERELEWEPVVRSAEIGVGVKDGVVTLMGSIESYAAKRAAERAAARVRGVRAVSSQLDVKQSGPGVRSDAEIAWAAANVLAWNTLVSPGSVRVQVSRGWVLLDGTVDWRFQSTAAENAVAELAGVVGVTNLISVCPAMRAEELKESIETALKRSADVDERRVIVETNGDCVTLWGSVQSPTQREAAEQAAWSAPGVREVSNHIMVVSGVAAGTGSAAHPS